MKRMIIFKEQNLKFLEFFSKNRKTKLCKFHRPQNVFRNASRKQAATSLSTRTIDVNKNTLALSQPIYIHLLSSGTKFD